eukprot:TRINITY_DN14377_c0_g1_i1.p2 TRINITY_DN14377_c0_g1~~TRINITY_DN14377_c0_g1_i1.p2  ORF type:complete len:50 (-),score=1.31 TRINITY_DN14377_c0_g1_i1:134-283(-)
MQTLVLSTFSKLPCSGSDLTGNVVDISELKVVHHFVLEEQRETKVYLRE